jgi:hypothetical protein
VDKLGAIQIVGPLDVSRAAERYVACPLDLAQADGSTKNVQQRSEFVVQAMKELHGTAASASHEPP